MKKPPPLNPARCTRAQLSQVLGVALTTVDEWKRKGAPLEKVSGRVYFSVPKVFKWKERYDNEKHAAKAKPPPTGVMLDLVQEQARLASAKASDQERKNRIADGELVTVEEVGAMYAPFGREVRQRLISLGSKVGPKVGRTVAEQRRLKAAIDEETYKALKAIHEYEHKAAAE